MKYLVLTTAVAFAASAFAQGISIATPAPGEVLTIGKPFTVEIDKPITISPSQSVSVVVGLQTCGSSPCTPSDDQILGQILFAGNYTPQLHNDRKPPYQNFTFSPLNIPSGNAVIHVAHFFVVGAGPSPSLETKNVSVIIRGASG